jgi:SAM-dependent methyltransferase
MTRYVLDHRLEGERERLALMSRLLDPMHRRYVEALGIGPGARTLEVGCGNGSVSGWLAERVGQRGQAVAVDIDLSLVGVRAPNLDIRQADITAGPIEPKAFDLVSRNRSQRPPWAPRLRRRESTHEVSLGAR